MKQFLSIPMLLARATLVKLLALILATGTIQSVFFFWQVSNQPHVPFDSYIMQAIFLVSLLSLAWLLVSPTVASGSKLGYTIDRLVISKRSLFFGCTLYTLGACLIFWGAEAMLMVALCRIWEAGQPGVGPQEVFLTFYRSEMLHSLLPLGDISRWIRTALFFVGLAATATCGMFSQFKGKTSTAPFVMALYMGIVFPHDISVGWDITHGFFTGIMIFFSVITATGGDEDEEDGPAQI